MPEQKLLLIDGEPGFSQISSEVYYFRTAISPQIQSRGINILSYNTFPEDMIFEAQNLNLTVIANFNINETYATTNMLNILSRYLRKGGNLLINLDKNIDVQKYNEILGALLPRTVLDTVKTPSSIGYFDNTHAIFKPELDFGSVRVSQYYKTTEKSTAKVLIKTASGDPLLIEWSPFNNSGKVFLLTTTIDREWTNFPAYNSYVALWQNLIRYCSQVQKSITSYFYAGDSIDIPLPRGYKNLGFTKYSNKQNVGFEIVKTNDDTLCKMKDTAQPGIYCLNYQTSSGNICNYVIINAATTLSEPDLTKTSATEIQTKLPGILTSLLKNTKNIREQFYQLIYGKDINSALRIALLLILVSESLLSSFMVKSKE